jgi:hypothetical protein
MPWLKTKKYAVFGIVRLGKVKTSGCRIYRTDKALYAYDDQVANKDDNSYQADADNSDYFDGMDDSDSDRA